MKWTLILLVAAGSLFARADLDLQREDGSALIAYFDSPNKKPFPIALLLQGGQMESALRMHDALKEELLELGYGVLTLEKQGISGIDQIDEKEYLRAASLNHRLKDHSQVLNQREKLSHWNGKLLLIGQSEGGKIAAALASTREDVSALVLISAGGGWTPLDELLFSFRTEMAENSYSPQCIHSFLVQAKQELQNARQNPVSSYQCFGFSYKYWDSLFQSNLMENLSKISCPIYYVHGKKDDRIPIESVEFLTKSLEEKKNLTIRLKETGREIVRDRLIYSEAFSWLKEQKLQSIQ